MTHLKDRMIRAAKLDVDLYEEVEADQGALHQAMLVVVLSSVAAGIGSFGQGGLGGVLIGTIAAIAGWYIWAYLTYFIGTRLLPEPQTKADHGELLRTIGFLKCPRVNSSIRNHPMADRNRFSYRFDLDVGGYGDCSETSA